MNKDDLSIQPIKLQIAAIKIQQFAFIAEAYNADPAIQNEINPQIKFLKFDQTKTIAVFIHITVSQGDTTFLVLEVGTYFNFLPEDWERLTHEGAVIIPKDLAIHLAFLAIGTVRGILYVKTEDKPITIMLPLIDVTQYLDEDVQFA